MTAFGTLTGPRGIARGPGNVLPKVGCAFSGYPTGAGELSAVLGAGITVDDIWLCNEASGGLVPSAGSPTLGVTGSPNYGVLGATPGSQAVQTTADVTAQCWSGGVVKNWNPATEDLIFGGVFRWDTAPAASRVFFGKRGVATKFWHVQMGTGAGGTISLVATDATNSYNVSCVSAAHIGSWFVLVAGVKAGGQARVGSSKNLGAAGNAAPGALGDTADGVSQFGIGRPGSTTGAFSCDYAFLGKGAGKAGSWIADAAAVIERLRVQIGVPA